MNILILILFFFVFCALVDANRLTFAAVGAAGVGSAAFVFIRIFHPRTRHSSHTDLLPSLSSLPAPRSSSSFEPFSAVVGTLGHPEVLPIEATTTPPADETDSWEYHTPSTFFERKEEEDDSWRRSMNSYIIPEPAAFEDFIDGLTRTLGWLCLPTLLIIGPNLHKIRQFWRIIRRQLCYHSPLVFACVAIGCTTIVKYCTIIFKGLFGFTLCFMITIDKYLQKNARIQNKRAPKDSLRRTTRSRRSRTNPRRSRIVFGYRPTDMISKSEVGNFVTEMMKQKTGVLEQWIACLEELSDFPQMMDMLTTLQNNLPMIHEARNNLLRISLDQSKLERNFSKHLSTIDKHRSATNKASTELDGITRTLAFFEDPEYISSIERLENFTKTATNARQRAYELYRSIKSDNGPPMEPVISMPLISSPPTPLPTVVVAAPVPSPSPSPPPPPPAVVSIVRSPPPAPVVVAPTPLSCFTFVEDLKPQSPSPPTTPPPAVVRPPSPVVVVTPPSIQPSSPPSVVVPSPAARKTVRFTLPPRPTPPVVPRPVFAPPLSPTLPDSMETDVPELEIFPTFAVPQASSSFSFSFLPPPTSEPGPVFSIFTDFPPPASAPGVFPTPTEPNDTDMTIGDDTPIDPALFEPAIYAPIDGSGIRPTIESAQPTALVNDEAASSDEEDKENSSLIQPRVGIYYNEEEHDESEGDSDDYYNEDEEAEFERKVAPRREARAQFQVHQRRQWEAEAFGIDD